MTKLKFLAVCYFGLFLWNNSHAQTGTNVVAGQDTSRRVITTAVPFLLISPDARASGMGDVGAATSPDGFSSHWNPAKLAFINKDMGFTLSYTPWLSNIVSDMSISYLTGFKRISNTQVLAVALRYFDLGDIQLRDELGGSTGQFNPREFEFNGTYSQVLTENLSIGANIKFILSNLSGNIAVANNDTKVGTAVAVDMGVYYTKDLVMGGTDSKLALAGVISNIGNKITYNSSDNRDFIPANLRLGSSLTMNLDPYNTITFALDLNKLMVPTPPIYELEEDGSIRIENDQPVIREGKDPTRGYLSATFGSFGDAPDGFSEEMKEFIINFGAEYWYNKVFAARLGYFYENPEKGDRKYFSMGLGFRYQKFGLDAAYLLPQTRNHPLAETLRFSLSFNFEASDKEAVTED